VLELSCAVNEVKGKDLAERELIPLGLNSSAKVKDSE